MNRQPHLIQVLSKVCSVITNKNKSLVVVVLAVVLCSARLPYKQEALDPIQAITHIFLSSTCQYTHERKNGDFWSGRLGHHWVQIAIG